MACQFAASGCDYRGPSKSMAKHQTECRFKKEGKGKFYFIEKLEWPWMSGILELPSVEHT